MTRIALTQTWNGSAKRVVLIDGSSVTLIGSNTKFSYESYFQVNRIFKIIGDTISPKAAIELIEKKKVGYENHNPDSDWSKTIVKNAIVEIDFIKLHFKDSLIEAA